MFASAISVFVLLLKDKFPKGSVFVKCKKVNLDIWRSILFKLSKGLSIC